MFTKKGIILRGLFWSISNWRGLDKMPFKWPFLVGKGHQFNWGYLVVKMLRSVSQSRLLWEAVNKENHPSSVQGGGGINTSSNNLNLFYVKIVMNRANKSIFNTYSSTHYQQRRHLYPATSTFIYTYSILLVKKRICWITFLNFQFVYKRSRQLKNKLQCYGSFMKWFQPPPPHHLELQKTVLVLQKNTWKKCSHRFQLLKGVYV